MKTLIDAVAEFTEGNLILERLLYVSAEILVFGGLLAVVFTLFRVRPRVRATAWQIFFVVILFHFSFGPVLTLSLPERFTASDSSNSVVIPMPEEVQPIELSAPAAPLDQPRTRSLLPATTGLEPDPAVPAASPVLSPWPSIAFGVWGLGALSVGAFYLFSRYRLFLLVRRARQASSSLQEELRSARRSLAPWLRPRFAIVPNEYGPAVGGVLRPVVIIPEWLEAEKHAALRYWAIRHELMHLHRFDHWTDLLRRIACSLFFFHPVIWLASRSWEKAAELVCDQALPRQSGEATDYAKFLLEYADRADPSLHRATAGALTATRVSLAERIRALLKWNSAEARGMSWRSRAIALAIGIFVLTVGVQLSNDAVSAQEGDGSFVSEWRNWFGAGKRFPQDSYSSPPVNTDELPERVLRFPERFSLGQIHFEGFEGEARGTIVVPAGVSASLSVSRSGAADLSCLAEFPRNAIQRISFRRSVPDAQLAHMSHLTGLRHVNLFKCGISDEGLAYLSDLTNLVSLDLNSTFITDEGLRYLRGMQQLDHLDINRTLVTDAGMVHVAELKHLSDLDLWRTGVTDEGVAILSSLPRIHYIGLEDCSVTDAAVQYFRNWTNLAKVDLENTAVTDEAIRVLKDVPNMRWLDLVDTRITAQGTAQLVGLNQLRDLNLPVTIASEDVTPLAGLPTYDALQNRGWSIPVTLEVRNRISGEGIPHAEIVYIPSSHTDSHFDGNNVYHIWTDANGQVTAYGNPGQSLAQIRVLAPGYVGLAETVHFGEPLGESGGEFISIALEPGVVIGGIAIAPGGEPLSGASVSIPTPGPHNIDDNRELPYSVLTDERGRWTCDRAPRDLSDLTVSVEHPHYSGVTYQPKDLDANSLLSQSAVLQVRPLLSIRGSVVDSNGNAIPNAFLVEMQPWRRSGTNATIYQATTDSRGRFALPAADLGSRTVRVSAAGYVSSDVLVDNSTDQGSIVITLVAE